MSKLDTVYAEITDLIIEQLESGTMPWRKSWNGEEGAFTFPKRHNGEYYQGANIVILWAYAEKKGYKSPYWFTYKQAHEMGGNVKKGEKAAPVFYASSLTLKDENAEGTTEEETIHYRKRYNVFNADQIEGLEEKYYNLPQIIIENPNNKENKKAESFIENLKINTITTGNQPKYIPVIDTIEMPDIQEFLNSDRYYSTYFHEVTHWTGHKKRLNRDFSYDKEELIAELGGCFLSVENGVLLDIEEDHAPYIAGWLKALKNDKTWIFKAASQAQQAANFCKELQK